MMYHTAGKRAVDLVITVPAVLLLFPLLGLVGLLVLIKSGFPIFFRQKRPGLHGRPFTLLKFRTMSNTRNSQGDLLTDGERLTSFARFLRSSSLDELPELFNVLKGDMSLVGPRPLLMEYLGRYTTEQARRHNVRPGITGWAQINGRNAITWEEKFALDVWYVERCGLWLDLRILLLTLIRIVRREGISAEGHSTMPYFFGSQGNKR